MVKFESVSDMQPTFIPFSEQWNTTDSREQTLRDQIFFWKNVAQARQIFLDMSLTQNKAIMNFLRSKNLLLELSKYLKR